MWQKGIKSADGIVRFPRPILAVEERLPKNRRPPTRKMTLPGGRVIKLYDKLTRRQKKAARMVINGMTVRETCRKLHMDSNTWYRWMHNHERFRRYYLTYASKQADNVTGRLDAKLGRAVSVVEDSLDSSDPYFAHESAVKLLSGRGLYKKSVEGKTDVSGAILHGMGGKVVVEQAIDKDLMLMFIDAITGKSQGGKEVKPIIIDAEIIKMLPEPPKDGIEPEV